MLVKDLLGRAHFGVHLADIVDGQMIRRGDLISRASGLTTVGRRAP
jgi:hypothetical protein